MERRLAHAEPLRRRRADPRVERVLAHAEPLRGRGPHARVERQLAHAEPVCDGRECRGGRRHGVGRGDARAECGRACVGGRDAWAEYGGGDGGVGVERAGGWVGESWAAACECVERSAGPGAGCMG